jgi:cell fate (sporulation/competence/biofilm development) regulator YlbF (YheA/YmcA/DUF963 family)
MSGCADTCQIPVLDNTFPEAQAAAERLGGLLVDTPEFQTFSRTARAVNLDPQVRDLFDKIHERQMQYYGMSAGHDETLQALNQQIEEVPVVLAYRAAERALRALFTEVNQIISQEAGVAFAANARAACG